MISLSGVKSMEDLKKYAHQLNWVLLGLLFVVAGLLKLFSAKASGVASMLSGLGFPASGVLAWVLIVAELASGILILARWQLKYVTWIPVVVLVVAAFTAYWGNWVNMLLHLALASNYVVLGQSE